MFVKLSRSHKTNSLWMITIFFPFILNNIAAFASSESSLSPQPPPQSSRKESSNTYPPIITEQPTDWLVDTPVTIVRLNCRARGYPKPVISWRKDGISLDQSLVNNIVKLDTGDLTFIRVINRGEGVNTGIYQCFATNDLGTVSSRNASVQMSGIEDNFRKNPRDTVGAIQHSVTIECKGPPGIPEPTISWRKDKEKLSTLIPKSRFRVKPSGDLIIYRLRKSDSGSYECVASNSAGERKSTEAVLMVQEPPRITVLPTDQTVQTGQTIEIQCDADGDPRPSIQWSKINGTLSERSLSIGNGNMRITEAKVEDSGEYVCTALSRVGMDKASAVVIVQEGLEIDDFHQNSSVFSGNTVTLPCNVRGAPNPTAIWRSQHYDEDMRTERSYLNDHFFVTVNGELVIHNARFDDEGRYVCRAANSLGSYIGDIRLAVQPRQGSSPPIIRRGPANVSVSVNSDVILECSSRHVPHRDIRWYKEGKVVETDLIKTRMIKQSSGSLKILSVQAVDSARYTCKVSNDYGMTKWNAWLTVTAQEGVIAPPTRNDIPRPPGKPTLVNATSSYVTVTWKASSTTRDLIQHYALDYYRIGSSSLTWSRVSPIFNNVYTLRHLPPSSDYIFVVRTRNQHGISNASPVSKVINTIDPPYFDPALPGTYSEDLRRSFVTLTQALPLMNPELQTGLIRLHWDTNSGCEIIDGFVVVARSVASKNSKLFTKQVSCSQRKINVPNLISGNKYEIRICPFKDLSSGPASPIVFVSLQTGMIEAAPPLLNAKTDSSDEGKISFLWQPPRDLPAAYVSSYMLTCWAQNGTFSRTIMVNSSITEVAFTGLRNSMAYDATVTYFTQLGKGVTSNKRTIILKEMSTELSDLEEGKSASLFRQPAVIAGCAVALLAIIGCIVGGVCYQRSRRKWKTKSLSGSHRSARFDPTMPFDGGFQITKSVPSGPVGNVMEHANRNHTDMQNSSMNSEINTMVTYNPKNGEIENKLPKNSFGALLANQPSFSYVTNQLTCKSDIPPQFSRPHLSTQASFSSQQLRPHNLVARNNNISESEIIFETGQYLGSLNNIHGTESLPPPPPSPPLSQRTWISDRSHVSSNFHSTGSSRSGQRSRRAVCGDKLTTELVGKQHLTDTDTGIDSPTITPSSTRPEVLCRNGSPVPPTPPVRGSSNFSYGHAPWHSDRNRNAPSTLGYVDGPSEGDTDFECERFNRAQRRNFVNNNNPTNGLQLTNSSNVRVHLPELHINDLPYDNESLSSGEGSFHMESISQVGKNLPDKDQASPRQLCVSNSREKTVKDHYSKTCFQNYPPNFEDDRRNFSPGMSNLSQKHSGKLRRPKNTLSNSNHLTRSSHHHQCRKDNRMRIRDDVLTEQDIIRNEKSDDVQTERIKLHRSTEAQNVPSHDATPTNQNIDKLPRLDFYRDPNEAEDRNSISPSPLSPTESEVSDNSAYFSTASSCLSFKPPTSTNQPVLSWSQHVGSQDQVSEISRFQKNKKSTPGMNFQSSNSKSNIDSLPLSHHHSDEASPYREHDVTPTNTPSITTTRFDMPCPQ